jgi:hypothetical protein
MILLGNGSALNENGRSRGLNTYSAGMHSELHGPRRLGFPTLRPWAGRIQSASGYGQETPTGSATTRETTSLRLVAGARTVTTRACCTSHCY